VFHECQMARSARMNSRMRGAGCDHGIENRRSMCGLIWLPRPRVNRPLVAKCRSLAVAASVIGVRANATAIEVPSSRVVVTPAAAARGRKGSWPVSAVAAPS